MNNLDKFYNLIDAYGKQADIYKSYGKTSDEILSLMKIDLQNIISFVDTHKEELMKELDENLNNVIETKDNFILNWFLLCLLL